MPLHVPDPEYTRSAESRAGFRKALTFWLAFVGLLWVIEIANGALGLHLGRFGVAPREPSGLIGVLAAPLLHGGLEHLLANSVPLVVLGTAMFHLYPSCVRIVMPAIWLLPGIAVWLFARGGVHVGSSGLIYGLLAFVFTSGMLRRDRRAIAASLLAAFLYGSMVWGVLPIKAGVSWETHLAAAVVGLIASLALRQLDQPPRRRYSWEGEPEASGEEDGEPVNENSPPTYH
jgi:membrane associated rhomboid family serine protease